MNRFKTLIPAALVVLRFILGPLIWWSAELNASRLWFLAGLSIAFLSDIFDGILARRMQVATPALRVADGWVDAWFYGWMIASIWVAHQDIVIDFSKPILVLLLIMISEWIFSWFKFGKSTSYHAYSAKLFGIGLFVAIVSMMGFNFAGPVLWAALIIGCINSLENWLMSLILPCWVTDVPSVFHAWKLAQTLATTESVT